MSEMNFVPEDIRLAVKKGAAWLDETHPDWMEAIDLSGLHMANCDRCVIGQSMGNYYDTIITGAFENGYGDDDSEWAEDFGFQAPSVPYEMDDDGYYTDESIRAGDKATNDYYANLETVWTEEVKKRLG